MKCNVRGTSWELADSSFSLCLYMDKHHKQFLQRR